MVRTWALGAHSSADDWPAAARNRTGIGSGLYSFPSALAACASRQSIARTRWPHSRSSANYRGWNYRPLPGKRRSFPLVSAAMMRSILENLCLAGEVSWGRLALRLPEQRLRSTSARRKTVGAARGRPVAPTRAAPLAFVIAGTPLLAAAPSGSAFDDAIGALSSPAAEVAEALRQQGASFLSDLVRHTGRLPIQVEDALWELVACGFVTGDGMAGLRTLLTPELKRRPTRRLTGGWTRGRPMPRLMPVGRWSLLRPLASSRCQQERNRDYRDEALARQLLRRYGVSLSRTAGP